MKFTTGRPKPRFAKPVPVIVKLAGGLARSTAAGLIALTLGTVPLTTAETSPPFEVKITFAATTSCTVGLKEPPETMLKGGAAETVPVRVQPPELRTTKVLSAELPRFTAPKS